MTMAHSVPRGMTAGKGTMLPGWPDHDVNWGDFCGLIRLEISNRQALLMAEKRADPVLIREVEDLKKILFLTRQAFAKAVPDWRTTSQVPTSSG